MSVVDGVAEPGSTAAGTDSGIGIPVVAELRRQYNTGLLLSANWNIVLLVGR